MAWEIVHKFININKHFKAQKKEDKLLTMLKFTLLNTINYYVIIVILSIKFDSPLILFQICETAWDHE